MLGYPLLNKLSYTFRYIILRTDNLCMLRVRFCVSRKGRTGGGGWGQPQGDMHMVAARLGCQSTMVGTGWANSRPGCMDRLRKRYSHLVRGFILAGKVAWVLSVCMTTESASSALNYQPGLFL